MAAEALWDARGGHDPTVTAASTQRSRSPTPSSGNRGNKRGGNTRPKSHPLPTQISILFKTLAMTCAIFTTTTPIGLTGAFCPVLGRKTNSPPDPFRFSGFFHTCHCHSCAFSCKRWLDVSSGGCIQKTVQCQGKLFTTTSSRCAWPAPFWALTF
jgi:hypothetical protein